MLDKLNSSGIPEMLADFLVAARNPYSLQVSIMDRNDRIHYDKFCDGIVGCLKPANALETQLAFSVASDYWRLNRTRNIEDGIFASSHPNPTDEFGPTPIDKQIAASQTSAFLHKQSHFKFLSTYEMRLQRMLNRNKAELKQLQAERRKLEATQPDPPAPAFEATQQSGLIPTNNETQRDTSGQGFEFSNPPEPAKVGGPAIVRTAASQSQPAAPGFKATQQSGLILTNTETRGAIGGQGFAFSNQPTTAVPNGFAFSNPSASPVPAPQTAERKTRE